MCRFITMPEERTQLYDIYTSYIGSGIGFWGQLEAKVMPTLRRGSTRLDSTGLGRTQLDSLWLQLDWAPCWGSTRCWIQLIGNYTFWLVRNGNEVETKLCNRQGRQKVHGNFGPSLVRSGNLLGRLSKFIKNQWASADALPGINNDWTSAAFSTSKYPVFPAKTSFKFIDPKSLPYWLEFFNKFEIKTRISAELANQSVEPSLLHLLTGIGKTK